MERSDTGAGMKNRILSSTLMIGATILGILNKWIFIAIIVSLTMGGLYEFFSMIRKKGIPIYSYLGIFIGVAIPLSIFTQFELTKNWELLLIVTGFLILLLMQLLREDNHNAVVGISTTLFGVLYVSWFFSFLVKIRLLLPDGGGVGLLTFIIAVTKSGDIGALFIGKAWGRHALLAKVSPNKTVEGWAGSIIFGGVAALICKSCLPIGLHNSLFQVFLIGAFFSAIGQLGDISESMIKRDCNVKDSGKFMPGLGGVLDIIDSLLFAAPAFYLYISSALNTL